VLTQRKAGRFGEDFKIDRIRATRHRTALVVIMRERDPAANPKRAKQRLEHGIQRGRSSGGALAMI
jgi:hypothetical protein